MYRQQNVLQLEFPDFYHPFGGELDLENRWVKFAKLIPWELVDEIYHAGLSRKMGAPIKPARLAFGALFIKEKLGLTDRETVAMIQEHPYLQFLIGHKEFSKRVPFDASLMVGFRKRFGKEGIEQISEAIALKALQEIYRVTSNEKEITTTSKNDKLENDDDEPTSTDHVETISETKNATDDVEPSPKNHGKLIVDATCAPADIRFPTDVSSLNEAREKTEEIIDALHRPLKGKVSRPRTHRKKARKKFVAFAKNRKSRGRTIRKAKRDQLGFLSRNIRVIDDLLENPEALPLSQLSRRLYQNLLVCREFHRQQQTMFDDHKQRIDNRIVSLSQPHVRAIKRNKAGRDFEFGAKISLSFVEGFSFVERLSWDNYNESTDLIDQIKYYRKRFGFYPESVHADQIYRTRANRKFCKDHNIRMTGPPLGRPPKHVSLEQKRQAKSDEGIRNHVEGKIGQAKRRFSLARIMTKLMSTSGAQISLTFLVMNLEAALRRLFSCLILLTRNYLRRLRLATRSLLVSRLILATHFVQKPNRYSRRTDLQFP
jgi:hypothetical protein